MNAVGYVRVSTEEQAKKGMSLDHQRAKIAAYAKLHDMELIEIIADEGISGKDINKRPGALKVIEMAKGKSVDAVIIYKIDRLSRTTIDILETVEQFKKSGVAFHSVTESIDTKSAVGKLMLNLLAGIAEMEKDLIGDRTRDVIRHKKSIGQVYNHTPYGYDRVKKNLIPNMEEQKIIQKMRDMRSDGDSFARIACWLDDNNVPTKKGGKWYPSTIRQILNLINILKKPHLINILKKPP